jgi:hypothetical protein
MWRQARMNYRRTKEEAQAGVGVRPFRISLTTWRSKRSSGKTPVPSLQGKEEKFPPDEQASIGGMWSYNLSNQGIVARNLN